MTADNEELDALTQRLKDWWTQRGGKHMKAGFSPHKDSRLAAEALTTLRARVAELEVSLSLYGVGANLLAGHQAGAKVLMRQRDEAIARAELAESQLQQVKANAERTREENELLRLRVIDLQEQLQEPPRTETGTTLCQHRIAHGWMNSDGSSGFKCDECGLQYTAVPDRRNDGTA